MANRLLSFIDFKEREVDLSVIDGTEVNQRHCSSQGVLDLLPMLSNLLGPACSGRLIGRISLSNPISSSGVLISNLT